MISSSNQQTCKITAYLRVGSNPKGEPIHEAFANMGDRQRRLKLLQSYGRLRRTGKIFDTLSD